jgi:hypothetical protein
MATDTVDNLGEKKTFAHFNLSASQLLEELLSPFLHENKKKKERVVFMVSF